jgi:hypothetical protein
MDDAAKEVNFSDGSGYGKTAGNLDEHIKS